MQHVDVCVVCVQVVPLLSLPLRSTPSHPGGASASSLLFWLPQLDRRPLQSLSITCSIRSGTPHTGLAASYSCSKSRQGKVTDVIDGDQGLYLMLFLISTLFLNCSIQYCCLPSPPRPAPLFYSDNQYCECLTVYQNQGTDVRVMIWPNCHIVNGCAALGHPSSFHVFTNLSSE